MTYVSTIAYSYHHGASRFKVEYSAVSILHADVFNRCKNAQKVIKLQPCMSLTVD